MIYPDVDPKEWAETYGILIIERNCEGCKKTLPCDIPFAIKGWRGFVMAEHGCGDEFGATTAVPVGEMKDKWNKLIFGE